MRNVRIFFYHTTFKAPVDIIGCSRLVFIWTTSLWVSSLPDKCPVIVRISLWVARKATCNQTGKIKQTEKGLQNTYRADCLCSST